MRRTSAAVGSILATSLLATSLLATSLLAILTITAAPLRAQAPSEELPLAWMTATTGFGVAGSGSAFRSGLFEVARLAGAMRVSDDVAIQLAATTTDLLTASGASITDPRPIEPDVAGAVASVAFLSGPDNGGLGGTTSLGVGAFKHRGGGNTARTYLGFQFTGDAGVYRLPVAGDLAVGGVVTVIPESHGNTEFMFGITFGLRLF
jgi:hypothetical protein